MTNNKNNQNNNVNIGQIISKSYIFMNKTVARKEETRVNAKKDIVETDLHIYYVYLKLYNIKYYHLIKVWLFYGRALLIYILVLLDICLFIYVNLAKLLSEKYEGEVYQCLEDYQLTFDQVFLMSLLVILILYWILSSIIAVIFILVNIINGGIMYGLIVNDLFEYAIISGGIGPGIFSGSILDDGFLAQYIPGFWFILGLVTSGFFIMLLAPNEHMSTLRRIGFSAVGFYFGLFDLVTDIIVVYVWIITEQYWFAIIQLIILFYSVLFLIIFINDSYHHETIEIKTKNNETTQTSIPAFDATAKVDWFEKLTILSGFGRLWFGVKVWKAGNKFKSK